MRRPRQFTPGAHWFVTVRCARRQFRLRPDEERTELLQYFLAKALERNPGIAVSSVCAMSNHVHYTIVDGRGEMATFMEYLNGQLARALNEIDGETGQVWERRYSAIEIVDVESIVDRIVYTVTNPVASNLVATHKAWPGLVAWFGGNPDPIPCKRFRARAYRRAAKRAADRRQPPPSRERFTDHAELRMTPIPGIDPKIVENAIRARELDLAEARCGGVMGVRTILALDVFARPKPEKKRRMPLCHAASKERWFEYRAKWRAFVRMYRKASAMFRAGVLSAVFPAHTFRPRLPLDFDPHAAAA